MGWPSGLKQTRETWNPRSRPPNWDYLETFLFWSLRPPCRLLTHVLLLHTISTLTPVRRAHSRSPPSYPSPPRAASCCPCCPCRPEPRSLSLLATDLLGCRAPSRCSSLFCSDGTDDRSFISAEPHIEYYVHRSRSTSIPGHAAAPRRATRCPSLGRSQLPTRRRRRRRRRGRRRCPAKRKRDRQEGRSQKNKD